MSPLFLKLFRRENKCPHCAADKLSSYSLCATHLEKARVQFGRWTLERRRLRLCCYCDRKSFRGFIRCRLHAAVNRERIRMWTLAHPEHAKEAWAKKKAMVAAGICPRCPQHRKLRGKFKRCKPCRERANWKKANPGPREAGGWKWVGGRERR